MTVTDLVLLALAADQLVRIWLHPGGLFDDLRDWLITHFDPDEEPADQRAYDRDQVRGGPVQYTWGDWADEKIVFLLGCAFCLTVWASLAMLLLFLLASHVPQPWTEIMRAPVYLFAVARLATMFAWLAPLEGRDG